MNTDRVSVQSASRAIQRTGLKFNIVIYRYTESKLPRSPAYCVQLTIYRISYIMWLCEDFNQRRKLLLKKKTLTDQGHHCVR